MGPHSPRLSQTGVCQAPFASYPIKVPLGVASRCSKPSLMCKKELLCPWTWAAVTELDENRCCVWTYGSSKLCYLFFVCLKWVLSCQMFFFNNMSMRVWSCFVCITPKSDTVGHTHFKTYANISFWINGTRLHWNYCSIYEVKSLIGQFLICILIWNSIQLQSLWYSCFNWLVEFMVNGCNLAVMKGNADRNGTGIVQMSLRCKWIHNIQNGIVTM